MDSLQDVEFSMCMHGVHWAQIERRAHSMFLGEDIRMWALHTFDRIKTSHSTSSYALAS